MKPLISYYGGKQRLAKRIVSLLPPHTVYAEPFAGSCAVLFAKGVPSITNSVQYSEVINDVDKHLVNMYRVFQENSEKLLEKLELTLYSEAEYKRSSVILNNYSNYSELERAWAYFVNIQQSFSNAFNGGWRRNLYHKNSVSTWSKRIENLKPIIDRFLSVYVSCTDALTFIEQWDSPQTCFYCDPPYIGARQNYANGYKIDQYRSLIEVLSSCQSSFVLSHYNIPGVQIPASWEKYEISSYACANGTGRVNMDHTRKATDEEMGNGQRTEILWRVDRSKNVRKELIPVISNIFPEGSIPVGD